RADCGTGIPRRRPGLLLELLGFAGEVGVLDLAAKPFRVVALAEVVHPGLVIDPVGDLEEQVEVLGAEVELALGAAEVEAAVRPEVALGILAGMPPALRARWKTTHPDRRPLRAPPPGEDLARLELDPCRECRRALAERLAEGTDRPIGRIAD